MFILLPVICIFIDLGLSLFELDLVFCFDEQKHVKFCIKNCSH